MKALVSLVIVTAAALATAQTQGGYPAQADPLNNFGSLHPGRTSSYIESRTAMRKGDLVTIVVSEQFTGSLSASTNATKSDKTAVGRSELPILGDVLKWLRIPSLGVLGSKSNNADSTVAGTGTSTSQNRLNGRLAVTVVEVMPNGNMVIEGKRNLLLNKENVTITVTGVIRRDDVRADNSVLSENVADAEIRASGRGVIADRQRRGILTRVLDWLF